MTFMNPADLTGPRIAAVGILCVLAVYLIVLLVGSPIGTLGNKESSFVYAILVFVPVAAVCGYTISRKGA